MLWRKSFPVSTFELHTYFSLTQVPTAVHVIRDEAITIIEEILRYGVTPEYLVDNGIVSFFPSLGFKRILLLTLSGFSQSKDITSIALHELGYRVPDFLAPLPLEAPYVSPSPSPPPTVDLAKLEMKHRQQLLERKLAVAARNSRKAATMANELESLFSSEPSSLAPTLFPLVAPDNSSAFAAVNSALSLAPARLRPVAADFTADLATLNASTAPSSALDTCINNGYRVAPSNRAVQCVIDLSSDSESSPPPPVPSVPSHPRTSSRVDASAAKMSASVKLLTAVAAGGTEAQTALEEKEGQIREIVKRIAVMERLGKTKHSGSLTPMSASVEAMPKMGLQSQRDVNRTDDTAPLETHARGQFVQYAKIRRGREAYSAQVGSVNDRVRRRRIQGGNSSLQPIFHLRGS